MYLTKALFTEFAQEASSTRVFNLQHNYLVNWFQLNLRSSRMLRSVNWSDNLSIPSSSVKKSIPVLYCFTLEMGPTICPKKLR